MSNDPQRESRENIERIEFLETKIKSAISSLYNKHVEIDYKERENDKVNKFLEIVEDQNVLLNQEVRLLREKVLKHFDKKQNFEYHNNNIK